MKVTEGYTSWINRTAVDVKHNTPPPDPSNHCFHCHNCATYPYSAYLKLFSKEPYHTSILTGQGWINKLINGHPNHIQTELGMKRDVFLAFISKLRELGYADSKYVSFEEQLAIFLYASVTGLTVCHLGEQFL